MPWNSSEQEKKGEWTRESDASVCIRFDFVLSVNNLPSLIWWSECRFKLRLCPFNNGIKVLTMIHLCWEQYITRPSCLWLPKLSACFIFCTLDHAFCHHNLLKFLLTKWQILIICFINLDPNDNNLPHSSHSVCFQPMWKSFQHSISST